MADETIKPAGVNAQMTRMQQIKADQDAKLADLEQKLSAMEADERKYFFFHKSDPESVELVNILSSRVDAIRDPAKRKAFFLAHPELEVRYSFINFVKE